MQCKAKAKHTQQQCRQAVIPGMDVCHYHGGKTPIGPGLPQFKHGRYSTFLPSRMAADFDAAMGDPELVSLRKEIATVDARIIDVLKRVDTGEAGVVWQAAQAAMTRFDREWVKKDGAGMEAALADMRRLISQGASDWAAWRVVIMEMIESKRKLVDTEQRRMTLAHESLNSDRAMMMMSRLVSIVQKHINVTTCYQPLAVLGAIAADMQAELLMRKRDDVYEQVRIGPDAAD